MQNAYIFGFSIFHSGIWESSLRATQNCFQNFWKRKIDEIRFKPYVIDFGGPSTNQVSAGNFVTCFIKKIGKWGWVVQLVESWLNYAIVRREESTTPISLTPGSLEACAGPWFVLAHVFDGYYLPYMWGAGPGQAEVLAHVFGCFTWPTGLGIYYVISNIVYQTRNCSSIKRGQTIHRYSVLLQFN